ncbi:unnamed protein product, partial [Iphiclides podalirius]
MERVNGHRAAPECPFRSGPRVDGQRAGKPSLRLKVPVPLRLKNHLTSEENFDALHSHIGEVSSFNTKCSEKVCQTSIMDIPSRGDTARTVEEIYKEGQAFIKEYFASIRRENSDAHMSRLKEIEKELTTKGTYDLKTPELVFGAKLAWRNATRCIGRIQWKKLQIFDCREVTTASGMFEALCNHIKYATNKGNIRSAITIFPQRTDGNHDYRIWNQQLISYAGYVEEDGSILGDPARVEFTEICIKLGWEPPRTAWDILPLVLSADGKDPEFFDIPREIIMEVEMEHPRYEWFKNLDLRWYALPAVSGMRLDCGGLEFTGTAFNGWYMGTEIGCRNFCDANRLNIVEEPAWKTHQWSKSENNGNGHRKFHFKQIARAVKFTSKLFGQALSKRIKATILYGTETGKSEQYAKELGTIFGHAFNAQVHCMSEYDMFSIEHETLLLIVTSTFGNGEPPANGVEFAEHLFQMLYNEKQSQGDQTGDIAGNNKIPTPKSLMRTNSVTPNNDYKRQLSRLESNKSSVAGASSIENIGPLSNVCYAVFALGSSAYPKFCNFGKTVDKVLEDLGGERLLELACGDEMYGQEQQFRNWSSNIFHVACETFCLEENEMVKDGKKALGLMPLTEETVRFGKPDKILPMKSALEVGFRKQLLTCVVKENKHLGDFTADRATIFLDMESNNELKYEPGDHVGVLACNRKEIVDTILQRLKDVESYDKPVQLQVLKETLTPTGAVKNWEKHERLPAVSVRDIFTRFLDITTPPSTKVLKYLATACTEQREINFINELVEPRFYSISSSPLAHPQRIHITVAVVVYKTQGGQGTTHYGVCSTYLQNQKPNDELTIFIRRAPNFHMPQDLSAPLILVGPGSGIAPFRGFWHHRKCQISSSKVTNVGPIWLFFGCRYRSMDLYKEEKEEAVACGVLNKSMLALSREDGVCKKHVQALLEDEGASIIRMLLEDKGHFYVCGDCKMAEEVKQKLKEIISANSNKTQDEAEDFILNLMDENRYHEDIFGITLRTAVVHSASRESAKRTRLESASNTNDTKN